MSNKVVIIASLFDDVSLEELKELRRLLNEKIALLQAIKDKEKKDEKKDTNN